MKDTLIKISFLAGVAIIAGFSILINPASANPSDLNRVFMTKNGGSSSQTIVSTSTGVTYTGPSTATTSFPFSSDRTDQLDLNLSVSGSSSATTLIWTYEFSNDNLSCDTQPTACNWFPESGSSIDSINTVTYSSSTVIHSWKPADGAFATSSLNVTVPSVASRYTRVLFQMTQASGTLYAEVARKVQRP